MDFARKFHEEIVAFLEATSNREAANLYKKSSNVNAILSTALFKKVYAKVTLETATPGKTTKTVQKAKVKEKK